MGKWEMVRLGDVGEGFIGLTYKPEYISEDGIVVLRSGNIQNNQIDLTDVVRVNKEIKNKLILTNGDILICSRNGSASLVGKSALIENLPEKMTFGAFMMVYRTKYFGYILHFLHSAYFKRQMSKSATTTINQITKSMLEDVEIPFPPLDIQEKIAKNLDLASELVNLYKTQLVELDTLIQSVFYDMFGDPVTNEMGWEIQHISKITQVATGSTPNRGCVEYYGGQIPWVKTGEIAQGYIEQTEERITNLAIQETNCKVFAVDTILIAMYGQGKTRGASGMIKIEACTNQACAAIAPNQTYNSEFLYRQLTNRYAELRGLGRGGNQENLNLSMIKNLKIVLPPLPLQQKFANIVTEIEIQKAQIQTALTDAQMLYDSLMQQYFE